jgi:hypothetical protein
MENREVVSHKNARSSRWFANTALVIMGIIMLIFAWMIFAPVKTIQFSKIEVLDPQHVSQSVKIDFHYCQYTNKESTVQRIIRNVNNPDYAISLNPVLSIGVKGCHLAHVVAPLPVGTTPGTYTLHGRVIFQVNPVRTVEVDYDTGQFTIIN